MPQSSCSPDNGVPAPDRVDAMVVAMAREVRDGEFVAHGAGVPLAGIALLLARRVHAPACEFYFEGRLSPAVQSFTRPVCDPPTAGRGFVTLERMLTWELRGRVDFQFLRPLQVDGAGRVNASRIGRGAAAERFGGLAVGDAVALIRRVCLFLTEHSPRTVPSRVDAVTAVRMATRMGRALEPLAVVTPLGVFEVGGGALQVRALLPGVTLDEVRACTGARVVAAPSPPCVVASADEAAALAAIDPDRLRDRAFGGALRSSWTTPPASSSTTISRDSRRDRG